tara:strand:+ start:1576 stop:2124 length:549 start_codon:yes stop_codon:yes gene_type:complete
MIKQNLNEYYNLLIHYKKIIHSLKYKKFINILLSASKKRKNIFFCGNGGSAANSNHASIDLNNLLRKKSISFRSISLCSNVAKITAYANDYGYKNIFKNQLEDLSNRGDILIIFSVSGSSPNVIEAAKLSKKRKIKVISIAGYSGGKIKKYSDLCLEFNCKNYGMVEDLQMMLIHTFCEQLK